MPNISEDYIDSVQDDRRSLMLRLNAIIQEVYPSLEPVIWYGLLAYRKSKGWRNWVALGYRKDGVTLYTNGSHADQFKTRHPEVQAGKGSLRFKPGDTLSVDDLKMLIRNSIEDLKETP